MFSINRVTLIKMTISIISMINQTIMAQTKDNYLNHKNNTSNDNESN